MSFSFQFFLLWMILKLGFPCLMLPSAFANALRVSFVFVPSSCAKRLFYARKRHWVRLSPSRRKAKGKRQHQSYTSKPAPRLTTPFWGHLGHNTPIRAVNSWAYLTTYRPESQALSRISTYIRARKKLFFCFWKSSFLRFRFLVPLCGKLYLLRFSTCNRFFMPFLYILPWITINHIIADALVNIFYLCQFLPESTIGIIIQIFCCFCTKTDLIFLHVVKIIFLKFFLDFSQKKSTPVVFSL